MVHKTPCSVLELENLKCKFEFKVDRFILITWIILNNKNMWIIKVGKSKGLEGKEVMKEIYVDTG